MPADSVARPIKRSPIESYKGVSHLGHGGSKEVKVILDPDH